MQVAGARSERGAARKLFGQLSSLKLHGAAAAGEVAAAEVQKGLVSALKEGAQAGEAPPGA